MGLRAISKQARVYVKEKVLTMRSRVFVLLQTIAYVPLISLNHNLLVQ